MEVNQLKYFVAIAECGSFRKAAGHCNVAQPSLSQQIMKLERSLGHRLFDRLGRRIALTDAGHALLPRAKSILAGIEGAKRSIAIDVERGLGPIVVGAIPTIAPYLLPATIQRFRRGYAEAELSVREDLTDSLLAALEAAEIDIAFMSLPLDSAQIEHELLMDEDLVAVSGRNHPIAGLEHVALDDLSKMPAVVLHEMHCLGEQIRTFCRGHGVQRPILCRTTQLSTVQSMVTLELGVSLVPRMCAARDRSRQRVYRPLAAPRPQRAVVAAWRQGRERSLLAQRFIDAARVECARLTAVSDASIFRFKDEATG